MMDLDGRGDRDGRPRIGIIRGLKVSGVGIHELGVAGEPAAAAVVVAIEGDEPVVDITGSDIAVQFCGE